MTINQQDILNSILESLDRIDYIKPKEIPNIDLYMDQVTTFMEEHLNASKRYPEDKILTKTMINNYAKNKLLPPPEKKRYSKEHVLMLIFIYYFKNILSINDIQTLLNPLAERYFQKTSEPNLSSIYEEVFGMEEEQIAGLKKDIIEKFAMSKKTFTDVPEEDQEILQLFSFIFTLGYDVYVKKLLLEKLVDNFREVTQKQEPDTGKPTKEKPLKEKAVKDK